jgi:RNA polymerase sigma-70 factor (ECF subfamily)
MTDEQLIEGCKRSEHKAFEALYKKYAMRMMAIAQRYCNTTFESEDVLQEAFIKVFQKINSFDSKGSFEGWLKRVVVNTAINHYHQTYKQKLQVEVEKADIHETILPDAVSKMSNEELLSVIKELPEGYRMVFNLYVIEGYTHKEIGEMLNISDGTSKSQLAKAKNMIKRLLIKYNYVADEQ